MSNVESAVVLAVAMVVVAILAGAFHESAVDTRALVAAYRVACEHGRDQEAAQFATALKAAIGIADAKPPPRLPDT